jgi:catechol 2,3-dioxygenase-like lactoylglutathione lyase family enzyme
MEDEMRDLKIEVVVLPVADVARSKRFYEGLGWRVDADFKDDQGWHVVQMTPPGSPCSVHFGEGFTSAAPGSVKGTFLVTEDVDAARAELKAAGADVSEVFHFDGSRLRVDGTGRVAGRDPEDRSYFSFASFGDPDGNTWTMQEIKGRFPGRGVSNFDVSGLTELFKETEQAHGAYEATAAKHHWSGWYAAYIVARQQGLSAEEASARAKRNIEG